MAERDIRAARRYATALFEAAQKQSKLEAVEQDLHRVSDLMRLTPSLLQVWESPFMPAVQKGEVVGKVLTDSVDPLTMAFLRLLVDKRRENILDEVRLQLRRQSDAARRLVRADATFAVEPTAEEQAGLKQSLEQRTSEQVELSVRVDPAILGGVIVRMHDTIIDGSVRGTLERLREQMLQEA